MDARPTLRLVADEPNLEPAFVPRLTASCGDPPSTASPLFQAIVAARQGLLACQRDDGSWQSEVPGDVTLASHMIFLWACLGRLPSDDGHRVGTQIVSNQRDSGGWSLGQGCGFDLDASVLAYVALRLVGYEASTEPLQRARRAIRRAGGADRTGALTRCVLALLGQIKYDETPALPAGLVMRLATLDVLPRSAQALLIPLSIVQATRPRARVDDDFSVRELFIEHPLDWPKASWDLPELPVTLGNRVRHTLNRIVQRVIRSKSNCREKVAAAEHWLRDRLAVGDALRGELTPMVWGILALRAAGTSEDSPEVCLLLQQLDRLRVECEDGIGFRARVSNMTETARVIAALEASGLGDDVVAVRRGRAWLFAQESSTGSWTCDAASVVDADVSATAAVVASCRAVPSKSDIGSQKLPPELQLVEDVRNEINPQLARDIDRQAQRQAIVRSREWLCQIQQTDGRWATENSDEQAGSGRDVTGSVLAAMAARGLRCGTPTADRAVDFLNRKQRVDGGWSDLGGTSTVNATWQALLGLAAVGAPANCETIRGALNWLFAQQQADGSWDPLSDDDREGPSAKSNRCVSTSGVLLACVAAGKADHLAVTRGIEFLIDAQCDDGSWPDAMCVSSSLQSGQEEEHSPSTLSLPLLALSRYAAKATAPGECVEHREPPALKLFLGESASA